MRRLECMLFCTVIILIVLPASPESGIAEADAEYIGSFPIIPGDQRSWLANGDPLLLESNYSNLMIGSPLDDANISIASSTENGDKDMLSAATSRMPQESIIEMKESSIAAAGIGCLDISAYDNDLFAAMNNIGFKDKILVPSGITVNVVKDTIIPENISLVVERGGRLNISNGKRLLIDGELTAGLYQIFENKGRALFGTKGTGRSTRIVYPQWWGAVGNGVTDDSLAINLASNSLGAYGGIIYFSPGTYAINNSINIIKSNTTFRGDGETSILKAIADDIKLIYINGQHDIVIEKLKLDGNYKNNKAKTKDITQAQSGIYFNACKNLLVRDCHFIKFGHSSSDENYWSMAIFGLYGNKNITIKDNIIEGGKNKRGGANILLYQRDTENVIITGNRCYGPVDISILAFMIDKCSGIIITNNIIRDSGRHGIEVTYGDSNSKDAIISNNIIYNAGSTGIYNNGGRSILVNGNILHSCSGNRGDGDKWGNGWSLSGAIFCSGDGEKIITNNYIYNTGRYPNGTSKEGFGKEPVNWSSAIKISAPGGNSIISNNIIDSSIGHGIDIYHYWNTTDVPPGEKPKSPAYLNTQICGNRITKIDRNGINGRVRELLKSDSNRSNERLLPK